MKKRTVLAAGLILGGLSSPAFSAELAEMMAFLREAPDMCPASPVTSSSVAVRGGFRGWAESPADTSQSPCRDSISIAITGNLP